MFRSDTFLIYMDNYRRDFLVSNVIKEYLEGKGHCVFLTSRKNINFFSSYLKCDNFIFITNVFSPPSKKIISKIIDKNIIIIDAEGAQTSERCSYFYTYFQNIKKNMNFFYPRAKKIFVWNNNVKNFLINNNLAEKNKVDVVGSPKLSILSYLDKGNNNENKTIGFISRFVGTNDFLNRSTLESIVTKHYKNDEFIYSCLGEVESIHIFLNIIDKIIEKTNYLISIRPHPNENFSAWKILLKNFPDRIFLTDPKEDLIEWLMNIDQIVCTPSTSMVEPIVFNKKVTSIHKMLNDNKNKIYYEQSLGGLLEKVHSPENIQDLYDCLIHDRPCLPAKSENFSIVMKKYYNFENLNTYNGIKKIINYFNLNKGTFKTKLIYQLIIYFFINFYDFLIIKIKKYKNLYNHNEYNDYNEFTSKKRSLYKLIK